MLCSRTRRRTAGVMRTLPSPGRCRRGLGRSGFRGRGFGWAAGASARAARRLRLRGGAASAAGAASGAGASAAGASGSASGAALCRLGGGLRLAAASVGAAPAPSPEISASGVPTFTVSPSGTMILVMVPATSAGTSALTLSVTTSNSGSYCSTVSPSLTSQRSIVPSVTDSPSCGILMVVNSSLVPRLATGGRHAVHRHGALAVEIPQRADLAAMVQVVVDHRPQDPPGRPLLAPVRHPAGVQVGIGQAGQRLHQQACPRSSSAIAAAAVWAESISGQVSRPGPKAYSWYMTLHSARCTSRQPMVVNGGGSGSGSA